MEYDKRIVHPTDTIWNPFSKASEQDLYEGLGGYFTDCYCDFADLDNCYYGTLSRIDFSSEYPYHAEGEAESKKEDIGWFAFFLPERDVKRKEKKWNFRPFNDTREFFEKTGFEVGDVIYVRDKDSNVEFHLMLVGWAENTLLLGVNRLNLKELFKWFELWDGENKFIPFGVEESC